MGLQTDSSATRRVSLNLSSSATQLATPQQTPHHHKAAEPHHPQRLLAIEGRDVKEVTP